MSVSTRGRLAGAGFGVVFLAFLPHSTDVSPFISVQFHQSQFPQAVRAELFTSLRDRRIHHKFHYDSVKQAQKWMAIHEAYSPARRDPGCLQAYDRCFRDTVALLPAGRLHVLGLGCGAGQKDAALLKHLLAGGRELVCTLCDVSAPLVLQAYQRAAGVLGKSGCVAQVCDLSSTPNLEVLAAGEPTGVCRLVTFFGMLPNFETEVILPKVANLIRDRDVLVVSANLAPGEDYEAGVEAVLPQYDNPETRDWLFTFLSDLGVEAGDGQVVFVQEEGNPPWRLRKVAADFVFTRPRAIGVESESFAFRPGDKIRLFYSYRHTPELLRAVMKDYGLRAIGEWIAPSGEEGLFLLRR